MSEGGGRWLVDPVLSALGIVHGFGERGGEVPDAAVFPRQVHGVNVALAHKVGDESACADAILGTHPGACVAIVTADCVPVLAATVDGRAAIAIHAGWRGLAAGVLEAGLNALAAKSPGVPIAAVVGPAARGCCYEVDEPVRAGLSERYAGLLGRVMTPGRAGRSQLDLPLLAEEVIRLFGVKSTLIGIKHRDCTICSPARFESYRRDGAEAGRLKHFITVPTTIPCQG